MVIASGTSLDVVLDFRGGFGDIDCRIVFSLTTEQDGYGDGHYGKRPRYAVAVHTLDCPRGQVHRRVVFADHAVETFDHRPAYFLGTFLRYYHDEIVSADVPDEVVRIFQAAHGLIDDLTGQFDDLACLDIPVMVVVCLEIVKVGITYGKGRL